MGYLQRLQSSDGETDLAGKGCWQSPGSNVIHALEFAFNDFTATGFCKMQTTVTADH